MSPLAWRSAAASLAKGPDYASKWAWNSDSCAHFSVIQAVTIPEWGGAATAQGVNPISANLSRCLLVDLEVDLDLDLDFDSEVLVLDTFSRAS
jgi:hypothetical protein